MSRNESLCTDSKPTDYEIFFDRRLGKGGFGEVYLARSIHSNRDIALKLINKAVVREKGAFKRVWDEVRIHSPLKHPRIVELLDCFQDEKYIYIALELCPNGDMRRYLKVMGRPLDEAYAAIVLEQVVDGILFLHSRGIIHRDLSASNILLDSNWTVKIADFGLATQISQPNEKHFTMCGTPNYIAPEIAMRKPHGLEADVWSLGCLLYTLLTGHPPFGNNGQVSQTLKRIITGEWQLPNHISIEATDLIRNLLRSEAGQRIKINAIRNHPFFKKYRVGGNFISVMSTDSGRGTISTGLHTGMGSVMQRSRSLDRRIPRRAAPSPPLRALPSRDFHRGFENRSIPSLPPLPGAQFDLGMPDSGRMTTHQLSTRRNHNCEHGFSQCCAQCNNMNMEAMPDDELNACTKHPVSGACCALEKGYQNFNSNSNCALPIGSSIREQRCASFQRSGICRGNCNADIQLNAKSNFVCYSDAPCTSKTALSKEEVQITLVRDQSGRCLRDIVKPLNSKRLTPTKQTTNKVTLNITEDNEVVIQVYMTDRNCSESLRISPDGMKIIAYQVERKSGGYTSRKGYTFDSLPVKYWKFYQMACKFVELIRVKTVKIVLYTSDCKCHLMEDSTANIYFNKGQRQAIRKANSGHWICFDSGRPDLLSTKEEHLCDQILGKCLRIEQAIKELESDDDNFFPLILGRSQNKQSSSGAVVARQPTTSDSSKKVCATQSERQVYLREYKCRVMPLEEGGLHLLYDTGEELKLLKSSNNLEYTNTNGETVRFTGKHRLPTEVKLKLSQIDAILKLYTEQTTAPS
ncbi:Serine/threonine-protein kinase PLK4 [Trichinella pseudospiralis]|uniref:Serine/threonine-protein kinase SAK n=1 Tax=Trichinella pseudospiralis TaxID=6337 RepID=A0A0V1E8J4_TRIPS|nr:Serine/threonine-protein kinase PLK4 [Trichinella pseudospiralis]